MKKLKFSIVRSLAILVAAALCSCSNPAPAVSSPQEPNPNTFEDCLRVRHKLLRTFPAQCVTADGKVFVDTSAAPLRRPLCLNRCGDGSCDEIVCAAENCPCAESAQNCPADCDK